MKFKYPKRKKTFNLVVALFWVALGVFAFFNDVGPITKYIWFVLGALYLGIAIYMQVASYVTITQDAIIKNNVVPIKIPLSKITDVKHVSGAITIAMESKKMKIRKGNIQKNQRPVFEEAIASIEKEYVSTKT